MKSTVVDESLSTTTTRVLFQRKTTHVLWSYINLLKNHKGMITSHQSNRPKNERIGSPATHLNSVQHMERCAEEVGSHITFRQCGEALKSMSLWDITKHSSRQASQYGEYHFHYFQYMHAIYSRHGQWWQHYGMPHFQNFIFQGIKGAVSGNKK